MNVDASRLIQCAVAPASIDRLDLVLRRIVAAAALQTFLHRPNDKGVIFEGAGEIVSFSLTEPVRRLKHEHTDDELAQIEKWERKREKQRLVGRWDISWNFQRPQFPEWDYHPTGQLAFELEHVY